MKKKNRKEIPWSGDPPTADEVLMDEIEKRGKARMKDLLRVMRGLSRSTVARMLANLKRHRLVSQVGEKGATYYMMKPYPPLKKVKKKNL